MGQLAPVLRRECRGKKSGGWADDVLDAALVGFHPAIGEAAVWELHGLPCAIAELMQVGLAPALTVEPNDDLGAVLPSRHFPQEFLAVDRQVHLIVVGKAAKAVSPCLGGHGCKGRHIV